MKYLGHIYMKDIFSLFELATSTGILFFLGFYRSPRCSGLHWLLPGTQNCICSWCLPALCFFRFQTVLQAGVFPVSVFVGCLFLSLILHLSPSYFLFLPPPLPLFSSSPLFLLFSCPFLVLCFESEMPPTGSYFECPALSFDDGCLVFQGQGQSRSAGRDSEGHVGLQL